ncbi:dynein light chain lc6, flagellar outer arm [Fagus crenata]
MASHEKQKKGFMSIYKSTTGNHVKPVTLPAMMDKKSIQRSWFSRKPKNCKEIDHQQGGQRVIEESRGGGQIVEARKSVSHVETNLSSVATFLQVKVLVSDMPGFMQVHAFRCARRTHDTLEKFSSKHMAFNIKKEFDKVYGPAWHCIVGSSFGSFVTHSTGGFLYFSMEKLYILLFKTKIQKALD